MYLFDADFWKDSFGRAVKTVAQAAIAVITGETFGIFNGEAWINVLSISLMAGLVSILMSLSTYSAVNNDADVRALEHTVNRMTRKTLAIEDAAVAVKNVNAPASAEPAVVQDVEDVARG